MQCKVDCPSDYQMQQHLKGRKHMQRMKGGSGEVKGICFDFKKHGYCSRGASCTYKHIESSKSSYSYGSSNGQSSFKVGPSLNAEGICFDFKKKGYCMFGSRCNYKHVDAPSTYDTSFGKIPIINTRRGRVPAGYCFLWWTKGTCYKGGSCTYKHHMPEDPFEDSYQTESAMFLSPTSSKFGSFASGNIITPKSSLKRPIETETGASTTTISAEFLVVKNGPIKKQEKTEEKTAEMTEQKPEPTKVKIETEILSIEEREKDDLSSSNDKAEEEEAKSIEKQKKQEPSQSEEQKEEFPKSTVGPKLAPIFCRPVKKQSSNTAEKHNNNKPSKKGDTKSSKLAPIFCRPAKESGQSTKKKERKPSRFAEKYRNLFYRKKDVNLYIKDGLVVWEFAYNRNIIEAVKLYIKGRAWNPSLGIKGCWTNPIESLPDAIELYEHLGRVPSDKLKKRAEEVKRKFGGASPSDTITLTVEINVDELKGSSGKTTTDDQTSFGSVSVKFLYDASIVDALKELPPSQRKYDPDTKIWTVELLALNNLVESLGRKDFNATGKLVDLSSLVKEVNHLMFDHHDVVHETPSQSKPEERSTEVDNDIIVLDCADDEKDSESSKVKEESSFISNSQDTTNPSLSEEERIVKLQEKMMDIIDLVSKASGTNNPITLLSSDCGTSKKQKTSPSYSNKWLARLDGISNMARKAFQKPVQDTPSDCDCGRPEIKSQGIHTCRYFGTFECFCGNRWTSAYCWKGEKQACRSCEAESFPSKKRPLERGLGSGGSGMHDSSRCGRCKSLGYSCKGVYFTHF